VKRQQASRAVDRERSLTASRALRWWAAAILLGGAGLLWTLEPEPLQPIVAAAPAGPVDVPGRSPFPFGSGPPVSEPAPVPEPASPAALVPSGTALVPQWDSVETPEQRRARFDKLRWFGTNAAELAALALQMDAALPSVLQTGAIEPGDALVLKADLLDVLELDPTRRRDRLVDWWTAHPLPRQAPDAHHPAAAEYRRRELAVLAAWQAQRSEDRDAGELEESLEALNTPSSITR
jgi:hypothetical protein